MVRPILLASASPRRRRLLALLGVEYDCVSTDVLEDVPERPDDPGAVAAGLAEDKARAARKEHGADRTIVAADTIVVHRGSVLGKPTDRAHALRMLRELSSDSHRVITGLTVLPLQTADPTVEIVTSNVSMHDLAPEVIRAWVDRGESLGCAGAYNIESHLASVGPDECFQNVAGLPLCHLYRLLADERTGRPPADLTSPVPACDQLLGRTCVLGPRIVRGTQPR